MWISRIGILGHTFSATRFFLVSFQFPYSSSQCVVVLPLFRLALCTRLFGKRRRDGTIYFSVLCFIQKRFFNLFALHFLIYFFFLSFTPLSWRLLLVTFHWYLSSILKQEVLLWYYVNNEIFRGHWVIPKIWNGLMRVVHRSAARWWSGVLFTHIHPFFFYPSLKLLDSNFVMECILLLVIFLLYWNKKRDWCSRVV